MKKVRLVSVGLKIISLFTFGLCLLFGWLFYALYLKWFSLFENGRYFDPGSGVVYRDTGSVTGVLSLSLLLISIVLWLVASKIKGARRVL